MQPSYAIKTVHRRERAQDNRQEQLCDPLVPSGTYWYLSAAPELMELAAARLDGSIGGPR
jgi:hypothetical protein